MSHAIAKESIDQIFTEARTHHAWLPKPVSDDLLRSIYDLTKWGPTSVNCCPLRILFIKSEGEKAKLYPALSGSNVDQVKAAPAVAVLAMDKHFYEQLPTLFPAFDAKAMFTSNAALSEATAFRNSSLQGAYFIMAARAIGVDVCPMSGFDNAKVDETFFKGTTWKSNFICNVGYGDKGKLHPRGPRLKFDEVCKIV
jgi:3-hydroxypropanoate dehydrogenase